MIVGNLIFGDNPTTGGGGSDGGNTGSGSGGSGSTGGGSSGSGGGTTYSGDIKDGCILVTYVNCGCQPSHPGGKSNPECECVHDDIWSYEVICPLISNNQETTLQPFTNDAKNDYWDCVEILSGVGMITDSDLFKQRLMDCEGFGDPYDTDTNPHPDSGHPDSTLCAPWMEYKQDCLAGSGMFFREIIDLWSDLLYQDKAAFDYIIEHDSNCNGAAVAGLMINHPELDLSDNEIDVLLDNPECLPSIETLMGTTADSEILTDIAHALLENNQGRLLTNCDVVSQVVDLWVDNVTPSNIEELAETIIYWVYARGFFPEYEDFATLETAVANGDFEDDDLLGTPLTTGEIWAKAKDLRDALEGNYPDQLKRIDSFYVCRVLGPAFEEAVLQSLGYENFDANNAQLPNIGDSSFTVRPDGYHTESVRWDPPYGPVVPNSLHFITEVKTKFTSPAIFNWTSSANQFFKFRQFLNLNQYAGTAPNMLYLILPANVAVDNSIIDACTQQNILLVTSSVNISFFNSDKVYATKPIAHNQWDLSYHPNQFETLMKLFPTNGLKGAFGRFNYDSVNFQDILEMKAAQFEASYLQPNVEISCPDE